MPDIHASAIIEGDIDLADDVEVGPGCVLTGAIRVGPGTRLVAGVYLKGPLTMGSGNTLYPGACLGFSPQAHDYDPMVPGCGTRIGDHNTFREGVTIHRAMTDAGPTTVGDHNYFMVNSHAGHDDRVADHCTFANGVLLAGHVEIADHVVMGGNAVVHQFTRIGRGVMFSGLVGASYDVPPHLTVTGHNVIGNVNLIGMRRGGMPRAQIDDVKWAFRLLYRERIPAKRALETLRERAESPVIQEYIRFIETSERGIVRARTHERRPLEYAEESSG